MSFPDAVSLPNYPLRQELDAPLKVARWRPLVHWLLAIPHILVLYALGFVSRIVWIISWFAILFTGNMPASLFGFQVMYLRYSWRVSSYLFFAREPYPQFEFETVAADPGTDPARLSVDYPMTLSRGLIFVKWLLVIPHFLVLFFLYIAMFVVVLIAFFAVLITGNWPAGMRNFVVGVCRWGNRVNLYFLLMTDQYPPFSLD